MLICLKHYLELLPLLRYELNTYIFTQVKSLFTSYCMRITSIIIGSRKVTKHFAAKTHYLLLSRYRGRGGEKLVSPGHFFACLRLVFPPQLKLSCMYLRLEKRKGEHFDNFQKIPILGVAKQWFTLGPKWLILSKCLELILVLLNLS